MINDGKRLLSEKLPLFVIAFPYNACGFKGILFDSEVTGILTVVFPL